MVTGHVGLLEHKMALQGPELRKSFEEGAGCERGFSVQNIILTPLRNRCTVDVQYKLIRVKLGPEKAEFNLERALEKWREGKDRQIYELTFKK